MPATRMVLVAIGSAGDVNPFLGLGRVLRARGHRVTLVTNPHFASQVEAADLELAALGTREDFDTITKDPNVWRGARGTMRVMQYGVVEPIRPVYEAIARRYEPGRTVVAASSLALGARIAQEKLAVPTATVHLQPVVFRSAYEMPVLPGLSPLAAGMLQRSPRAVKRGVLRAMDAVADRFVGPALNDFRAQLRLPPVRRVFHDWWHSPQLVLGLFPDWFAPPQPDWPPQTRLTGFPLHDTVEGDALSPAAQAWLAQGAAPVVFTPGSAMRHGRAFFEAGLEACRALGRRALILTRYDEHLPWGPAGRAGLPTWAARFEYEPLSLLLPRCAAVVHHGGIGTLSQGLAAGVPQLLMPMGHDQLDNAARAVRLGVAASVPPARFTEATVAARLAGLLRIGDVSAACAAVRARCRGSSGLDAAATALEGLLE